MRFKDVAASEDSVRLLNVGSLARRGLRGAATGVATTVIALMLSQIAAAADLPGAAGDPAAQPTANSPNQTAPESEIKARLDAATGALSIAGEPVHVALLRRFYAAHDFQPVWATQPAQATALWHAVLNAGDQALDPDLFHVAAFAKTGLSPIERDMLMSDAFLGYADALARGVMPSESRGDDEDLAPSPVDVVAAINTAITSANPEAAILALAPQTPEYAALRRAYQSYQAIVKAGGWPHVPETQTPDRDRLLQQRLAAEGLLRAGYATGVLDGPTTEALKKFQERNGLEPDGKLGNTTLIELNVPADARTRQIAVNLERQRWLTRDMPADRLWVNTANAQLELFRGGQPVFTTRVVVGETDKQTPEFQAHVVSVLYNPPWNIPYGIAQKEIMPLLAEDPNYLERHHMTMRENGSVVQEAGPYSALGRLKFEMPNRFDVYLHDTPQRSYFARSDRRLSHGCVRVQNPRQLASLLLGIPEEDITKAIDTTVTSRRSLPQQLPVFIVYETAWADPTGAVQFRRDVYERDLAVAQRLVHTLQPPMAGLSTQRRS
jgi:L,D-transpeptidase YcbB